MLEVGVVPGTHAGEVALTHAEARAHFGAWAIVSSPLVLGLDVRDDALVASVWDIIANEEALAVNRAWAGSAGALLAQAPGNASFAFCGSQYPAGCAVAAWQALAKPLPGGRAAVLVLNHGEGAASGIRLALGGVAGLACGGAGEAACKVRDVWAHADGGIAKDELAVPDVASHDSVFYVLGA
jgi:hypothetical protein